MAATRNLANPIARQRASARASVRQQWLLLGAVLLAVGLFGLWSRANEYREFEAEQRHLLQVQVQAIDAMVSQQLLGLSAGLRGVRDELARWPAAEVSSASTRRLKALSDAIPAEQTLLLLGPDGRVLGASQPELVGLDASGSDYFRQVRAAPDARRLWLSAPSKSESGDHAMNLTIAVVAADGAFGGAITATLEPSYFRTLLRSTSYAPDLWAAVSHGDGVLLVIEPLMQGVAGSAIDVPGSMFRRHRESGLPGSVLSGLVAATGEQRLMALRTVQPAGLALDKPIIVMVSRSLDAMFSPWRRQTAAGGVLYLLLCVASSISLLAMQRRQLAIARLELQREALKRQSAERLELALRGADLALWDSDLRTGVSTVSERWNSMLGLPHQAVLTDPQAWSSRVHPEDWQRVMAAQQAHLDGRTERFEAVYRMRHADGHWVWILDRAQVLERDADGTPLRMVGTHMDTTSSQQAQLALERSEQNLATTLQSIGDAVIATDPQGQVVRMNPTAERLTGWTTAEAIGQPLARVFHIVGAQTRQAALDPVREVLAHGDIVGLANDTVLIARDGREYQIADSAAPIRTPAGEVTGVVLVFSDVTERYRSEQALRANEERLRSLLDNLLAGVIVHGPDSRVLDANPAACDIIGLPLDQMRGKASTDPFWAFLEEDQSPMQHERFPVSRVLASGLALKSLVLGVRRADLPRPLWVLVNAYPVRDAAGALEQIVVTFSDISERKEAEFERQAFERELRESQKMEAIGTLAGGIAHDFNNILAAILGNVALAKQDVASTHPVSSSLEQINRAALRARHLVQQILSFSRKDAGGFKNLALAAVVQETLSLLRSTLPAGVRLDAALPAETLRIHGDSTQLQQVLLNLCTNAWHALPAQGGRIEIGFAAHRLDSHQRLALAEVPALADGRCLHLWVRDNGSGMDEATRQRIFDPFFTTKSVGKGTGLGLSVVHGIVGAHGGAITVDTAPGQGSCFHVFLPLLAAEGAGPTLPQPSTAGLRGTGQHVLYIDDDEVMVLMVDRLLARAGYRVTVQTDATLALALVQARPDDFDAVVTDFNMPVLSGLQVAAELAHLRPTLPVVISSGFVTDELREQAAHAGVRAVLKKEHTFDDLAAVLHGLLAADRA